MPKEKNYNPVAAQRKADKAKDIKKGKAVVQARRNEKLAQRNPSKIQEQIKALKAITEGGGKLTKIEEQSLESLERDLKAVDKARKALGDQAPTFRGPPRDGILGKRRRDNDDPSSDDSDVPDDVKRIPMPRDTPPPIPKPILDEWFAKRRARRNAEQEQEQRGRESGSAGGKGANNEPLRKDRGVGRGARSEKSQTPVAEPKVVYESKPVVRDLRKEAVSAFVPAAVRMKMQKSKGVGGLMEPDEADRLEREGYLAASASAGGAGAAGTGGVQKRTVTVEEVEDDED